MIRILRTSGNKDKKKKIVILTGPTSSGKTNLSIELARRYQTEIISADSMHVYKSFDIGTGKPSKNIMNTIPHHLIDIIQPDKDFDAWQYMKLSRDVINSSLNENLIVSGGTQLYIKSLLDGGYINGDCMTVTGKTIGENHKSVIFTIYKGIPL